MSYDVTLDNIDLPSITNQRIENIIICKIDKLENSIWFLAGISTVFGIFTVWSLTKSRLYKV